MQSEMNTVYLQCARYGAIAYAANNANSRAKPQRSGFKALIVTAGLVLLLWTSLWCAQAPQNSHWRLQSGCNYHSSYLNKEIQLHYGIWWHRRSSHVYSWDGRWSSKTGNSNHLWANHVKNRTSRYFCLGVRRTCSRPSGSRWSVSWFWVDVSSEELGERCG